MVPLLHRLIAGYTTAPQATDIKRRGRKKMSEARGVRLKVRRIKAAASAVSHYICALYALAEQLACAGV